MKGEQSKPNIRSSKGGGREQGNVSSEAERKDADKPLRKPRGSKIDKIKIDRTEICLVDPSILPEDAEFKGYDTVIVQDLKKENMIY